MDLAGTLLQRCRLLQVARPRPGSDLVKGLGGRSGRKHAAEAGLDRAGEGVAGGSLHTDHFLLDPAVGKDAVTNRLLAHARGALGGPDASRDALALEPKASPAQQWPWQAGEAERIWPSRSSSADITFMVNTNTCR